MAAGGGGASWHAPQLGLRKTATSACAWRGLEADVSATAL